MQLAGGGGTPVRVVQTEQVCVCVADVFGLNVAEDLIGSHTDGLTYDEAVVQAAEDVTQDDHLAQVEVDG